MFARNIQAVGAAGFGRARAGFTRDQVAQFSAASISVSIDNEVPQLLLLTQVNAADHQWGFNGQWILQTRGARITATGGLTHDLTHTSNSSPDPAQNGLLSHSDGQTCLRVLDFLGSYGAGFEAKSRFRVEGQQTLTILGARISTLRVIEHVEVRQLPWRHSNVFWVEPATGQVWQSRQHIHPDIGVAKLTTLRPSSV